MSHSTGKKEARKGSKKNSDPKVVSEDEMKKQKSKGVIKATY